MTRRAAGECMGPAPCAKLFFPAEIFAAWSPSSFLIYTRTHAHTHTYTRTRTHTHTYMGFPGDSDGKESACNAGDPGLVPGSGRSPGEGNIYPLQYSCLENSKDRGAWQATVHRVAKIWI